MPALWQFPSGGSVTAAWANTHASSRRGGGRRRLREPARSCGGGRESFPWDKGALPHTWFQAECSVPGGILSDGCGHSFAAGLRWIHSLAEDTAAARSGRIRGECAAIPETGGTWPAPMAPARPIRRLQREERCAGEGRRSVLGQGLGVAVHETLSFAAADDRGLPIYM